MNPNTIYCGDSIELLNSWDAEQLHLVFADPPYNIGYRYDKYQDDRPYQEYVAWSRQWMSACARALRPEGSFYIAIGLEYAAELRLIGRELGLTLRNWIIWSYTFGQNMRVKFPRCHTHILYFTKHPKAFTFNDHLLRFPSARHTEYQDLRAAPEGRLPSDVWDEIPRVCGTFKEREGYHGCQLPEALLHRILMASSNPGDIVLDPFVGSGTTAVAAKRLGRRYVGIDLSPDYVERTRARLAKTTDESQAKPARGLWPALHEEFLMQLYRETRVSLQNLLPNTVAMKVVARSLELRGGVAYSCEEIAAKLEQFQSEVRLPKLPNDTPFRARKHVTTEGKKYVRKVTRYRRRRSDDEKGQFELRSA